MRSLLSTRRFIQFLLLAANGGSYSLPERLPWLQTELQVPRPKRLGTTFSQIQCKYLELDYMETFKQVCSLGLDTIRLCSYWNEIEPSQGVYYFDILDWLLDTADEYSLDVVLTVGMKAPRWPEYHFPAWIEERFDTRITDKPIDADPVLASITLDFIEQVVEHTKWRSNIRYWQVENEALNALGVTAGRYLSPEFVQQEVDLVRRLSNSGQGILLTNSINLGVENSEPITQAFKATLDMADAVGVNVYTRIPSGRSSYDEPVPAFWRRLASWQHKLHLSNKEAWIAESQAEPWEDGSLVAIDQKDYLSSTPEMATELAVRLAQLGYGTILLWGCEYWYWHKKRNNSSWWDSIESLVHA
ncbi:MAG: beta-galactosidase [Chloroflexota bacterium]|nr:beta-galactosidase [Chloroflexota bacterium]MDQ5864678.1 beta-galactosidase [Chloroflexota bacterium]